MFDDIEWCIKEIYFWQKGTAGSFSTMLIETFRRADEQNKMRLGMGFPAMFAAILEWENEPSEAALWERYGIEKKQ